jgi:photosystem II stability/assembly factor-like uncharacterized protein
MSDRILVATRKGLFTLQRNNGAWKIAGVDFLADHVSMVLADSRHGAVYAGLDHGHFGVKMHKRNGDAAWEEIATPAYPEKPEGLEDNDMWGRPIPWTTSKIWALETGGPDEKGVLWCGTLPGGLFRSPDGGASWAFMRTLWDSPRRKKWMGGGADLPGIHSICVDPRDAKRVQIAVSCGGVVTTTDAGETWNSEITGMRAAFMPPEQQFDPDIQDAHRMVQCAANPDRLWVQHHNGIFRSDNGGTVWEEITEAGPSTFGFAVAVHPDEPDTAWFVPAIKDEKRIPVDGKVVVTRTRDAGKSFETLSKGLPQEHAYDLVFRHALDIDATGNRLAFGSTTGSLWVSEDQGDSWQTVSTNLPPVYCVRFG